MSRPPETLETMCSRRPTPRPVERRPGDVLLRLRVAAPETAEEATVRAMEMGWWPRVRNKAQRPSLCGPWWVWAGRP